MKTKSKQENNIFKKHSVRLKQKLILLARAVVYHQNTWEILG